MAEIVIEALTNHVGVSSMKPDIVMVLAGLRVKHQPECVGRLEAAGMPMTGVEICSNNSPSREYG